MRSPAFPLKVIRVEGDLARVERKEIVEALQGRLQGTFFTADLDLVRERFETVPWVRHAAVRRIWPDRLEVRVEEHAELAACRGDFKWWSHNRPLYHEEIRMFFLRKPRVSTEPLALTMSGVRMGERLLEIGADDPPLLAALALKVTVLINQLLLALVALGL